METKHGIDRIEIAVTCYEAYATATGEHLNEYGVPDCWTELPEHVCAIWLQVASAVSEEFADHIPDPGPISG